jgi:hypothetical protein
LFSARTHFIPSFTNLAFTESITSDLLHLGVCGTSRCRLRLMFVMGNVPSEHVTPLSRSAPGGFLYAPARNQQAAASWLTALFDSEAAPLSFQPGGFFLEGIEKDQRDTSLRVIGMVASLLMCGIPIPMELSRSAHL